MCGFVHVNHEYMQVCLCVVGGGVLLYENKYIREHACERTHMQIHANVLACVCVGEGGGGGGGRGSYFMKINTYENTYASVRICTSWDRSKKVISPCNWPKKLDIQA